MTPHSKRKRILNILSQKVEKGRVLTRNTRSTRSGKLASLRADYREEESDISGSDSSSRAGTRRSSRTHKRSSLRYEQPDFSDYESEEPSGRTSRSSVKPKAKKAKERFPIPGDDTKFSQRHQYWCMLPADLTAIDDTRDYVSCQGCSFMYHVDCMGQKGDRIKGNVIVLDERDEQQTCVLQCGRCSGAGKNGNITVRCFGCGEVGERCGEFMHPEKMAMDVDGDVIDVDREEKLLAGWNDGSKVMFRCMDCDRGCHFDHLPPPPSDERPEDNIETITANAHTEDPDKMQIDHATENEPLGAAPVVDHSDSNGTADKAASPTPRQLSPSDILEIYTSELWRCNECRQYNSKKVEIILGWRQTPNPLPSVPEDFNREYLIKFGSESYARATWVPATWLAGISYAMKTNFDAKCTHAINSSEDVIPEEWLRADIIFDVQYQNNVGREKMGFRSQKAELEALAKVTQALCKWQKLKYEECRLWLVVLI
jgi:chromodomain-helicase-DNA-binding protein 4